MNEDAVGAVRAGAVDAAQLLATFPGDQVGRQVARLANRLGLEHAAVTGAVVDAVSRDEDSARDAWGRLAQRDRRDDLDRGRPIPSVNAPVSALRLAPQ